MLAAGALVASLLAVAASPATAQNDRRADWAEYTTSLSACVHPATDEQAFSDVVDEHAFRDAISCVAYYGITNGTGDDGDGGTTYSPNQNVTRAQMAVFIARAAGVAGVDLGDAMSAGFTDIGDIWQEAQDAINRLGSKGMIPKGGEFRPDDDVTRGEMATFLIGLLNKAAMNVTIDSSGKIQLGPSGSTEVADDWFADARATVPAANDAEISALFELGVTKGASAAAVQDKTARPLDYNYEPFGTVNRGAMAEFITRALAHSSVRPAGISAQLNGDEVVVSARDAGFQPISNVTVDVFRIPTAAADGAFRANGSCAAGEVGKVSGSYACVIDGSDLFTGGDGDASADFDDLDKGGTTVWAWTGDNDDEVDGDTDLYRLDIPEGAVEGTATRVRISTEYPANKKVHLGSSVLYTVQLEDANGAVVHGTDKLKPRPAQFLVTLSTYAMVDTDRATAGFQAGRNPQGASVVTTIPLTTDSDGKAIFSVSGLPDPDTTAKHDKYSVDIHIQPAPNGNAPAVFGTTGTPLTGGAGGTALYYLGSSANPTAASTTGLVPVRVDDTGTAAVDEGLVFSTEASNQKVVTGGTNLPAGYAATTGPGVTITLETSSLYPITNARGASRKATVTITDQYGDPIVGARVALDSSLTAQGNTPAITNKKAPTVGRDGSYTFGWTRAYNVSVQYQLESWWDHDQDDCWTSSDCSTPSGTKGIPGDKLGVTSPDLWWAAPTTVAGTGAEIKEFDTEANTIVVLGASIGALFYDSNDRFNITEGGETSAASYDAFERKLAVGHTLTYPAPKPGSRTVNEFTLIIS